MLAEDCDRCTVRYPGIPFSADGVPMIKKMIFASVGAASLVAFLSILDLSLKVPFAGYSLTLDITFLISSAIIGCLGWDAYRDNC